MIVTLASSGPWVQSDSLTGGIMDCSVGPGVGWRLTTVQFASCGFSTCSVGSSWVAVGAVSTVGEDAAVGVSSCGSAVADGWVVGLPAALWQAARNTDMSTANINNFFSITVLISIPWLKSLNFTNEIGILD